MTYLNFDRVRLEAATLPSTPTLATAATILRAAICNAEGFGELTFESKDLAKLYAALNPPRRVKPGAFGFDWVHRAIAKKDDSRECLKQVYCDGMNFVATDGHRLHLIPCPPGTTSGYYDRSGALLPDPTSIGPFPDYMRIVSRTERHPKCVLNIAELPIECSGYLNHTFYDVYVLPNGALVNDIYFGQAIHGAKTVVAYLSQDAEETIRLELPDQAVAIIAPSFRKQDPEVKDNV